MWYLILAMILGIYLWGKLTSEKISTKSINMERRRETQDAQDFFVKYQVSEEEYQTVMDTNVAYYAIYRRILNELIEFLRDGRLKTEKLDELYFDDYDVPRVNKLAEFLVGNCVEIELKALNEFLANDSLLEMEELNEFLTEKIGMIPTGDMLIWGVLAKRGRIPHYRLVLDYRGDRNILSVNNDCKWLGGGFWEGKSIKEMGEARLKYLKWYNEEIQANGMKEELLFIKRKTTDKPFALDEEYFFMEDAKGINECESLGYDTIVFWKTIVSKVDFGLSATLTNRPRKNFFGIGKDYKPGKNFYGYGKDHELF